MPQGRMWVGSLLVHCGTVFSAIFLYRSVVTNCSLQNMHVRNVLSNRMNDIWLGFDTQTVLSGLYSTFAEGKFQSAHVLVKGSGH